MKTRKKKLVKILNIFDLILFTLPVFKLDLFKENYSTLSLSTRGYLYLFFLGIIIGLLLAYETFYLHSKKHAIIMLLSLIIGTCIPHHVPYNLQGNLHLLFAYLGLALMCSVTILNIIKNDIKLLTYYLFFLIFGLVLYFYAGMVSTLAELVVMYDTMFINYYLYKKHESN